MLRLIYPSSIALGIAACAGIPKQAGYDEVAQMVSERTGHKTHWDRGAPEDAEVRRRITDVLGRDLTEESAVQLALLNNRTLQATYEELGVAQADLVQAGLLRNPSFGVGVRFPEGPVGTTNVELSLVEDFLDLFMLPLRKRLAAEEFEHAKLRVANEVFHLVSEVRQQYYVIQAQQQVVALRRTVLEASETSAELAERQNRAGNIPDLELETERGTYQQAKLDLERDELQLEVQRERFSRMLGLSSPQTEWKISAHLDDIPPAEEGLEHVESVAISRRLDVAIARQETKVFAQALHLAKTSRWVGAIELGVSRAVGPETGIRVTGPTLRLELPVFDRRQGLIRRLEAQLSQSVKRLEALSIDAQSEVRAARTRLLSERRVVEHYRKVLLPIRERIVELSQERYNAMLLGVFQLLLARQSEVDTYRHYIESVRDYWIAQAELERAMGTTLKNATQPKSGESKEPAARELQLPSPVTTAAKEHLEVLP